jgi:hypothetical protein
VEHSTLVGCSILLLDQPADATHVKKALEDAGAHVFPASTVSEGLRVVEEGELSAAVLDYTRSIQDAHSVARRLATLSIPFVFCKDIARNEAWPHAPVLSRPIPDSTLIEALRLLLAPRAGPPSASPARELEAPAI